MATAVRSEFRDGSIMRIRCHQFLTYREVTINPGPRLNVVVGPNGTGKSSIVCAIAIGLGAKTSLLGRSEKLGEFVMQGCDSGFVEIELFREGRPNQIIKRCLTAISDSCKWYIDGKLSNQKEVLKVVERTGAQIANLCTFLPQEKVGEFSGFDAIELLKETEKAVGGPKLHAEHLRLVALEAQIGDSDRQVESKKARMVELKEQNKALERDREKMREREEHLAKMTLCKQRLLWIDFDEAKEACMQLKAQEKEAKDKVRSAEGKIEPLKEQVRAAHAVMVKHEKVAEDARKEKDVVMKRNASDLKKADDQLEMMEQVKADVGNLSTRLKESERRVAKAEKVLQEKKATLAAHDAEAVRKAVAALKEEARRAAEAFAAVDDQGQALKEDVRRAARAHAEAKQAVEGLGDANRAKFQTVKAAGGMGNDACRLRLWLDKNRGLFRAPVYGPTALEMTIADPEYLDAIEDRIPARALFGFVTECEEDLRTLRDFVKTQKAQVTVFNIEGGQLRPARPGPEMQELKRLGAAGVIESFIECPASVKQMLRDHAKIDLTVVGGGTFNDALNRDTERVGAALTPRGGNGFMAYGANRGGFTKYEGKASAYQQGQMSINVTQVRKGRALQAGGEDPEERARLQGAEEAAFGRLTEAQEALQALKAKFAPLKAKRDRTDQAYNAKRGDLSLEKRLHTEIDRATKKAREARAELEAVDVAKEKKLLVKRLTVAAGKRLEYLERAQQDAAAVLGLEVRLGAAKLGLEMAKDLKEAKKEEVRREEQAFQALNDAAAAAKQKFKDSREGLRKYKDDADFGAPIKDAEGNDLPLLAILNALPGGRPEVVAMHDASEQAAAAIHNNPAVIKAYNERKAEIEALEVSIVALEGGHGDRNAGFRAARDKWVADVSKMVTSLNDLFEGYMGQLGNEGRVEVKEDPDSLDKWGIFLLVSYRHGQAMVALNKKVQSGGERSVATIMYLMALQDMVKSPFRVVDEINQGMDERNERLVFKRIVENSVGPARPQYFLITPKLLQGLTAMEHEDVTVLFVFNGPWNLEKPGLWDLPGFFQKAAAFPADALKRRHLDLTAAADGEEGR